MKRASRVAVGSLAIGAAVFAALVPAAGAYLPPVSISSNVQVDTRDPAQPSVDYRSPVVAINPKDANNVVIASRHDQPDYFCHVHYSLDGGATWSASTGTGPTFPDPPVPVGKTSGTCWSPGVAFDAAGNVYVVAQDRPGGGGGPQTVIVWKSTDGGKTFGAPVTIPASTSSGFSVQSDIAADTTPASPHFGRIYVTWHEFPMGQNLYAQLVHSDDGGASWSAATNQPLPGPTGRSQQIPDLAVAPDGTVYDIFKGQSGRNGTGRDCAGIGFGAIPPGGTDCPLMVLRSSNGGVSFDGDPVTVGAAHYSDTAVGEEPSIVVTPSGTVLVAAATVPNPPPAGCTASLQAVVYRSTNRGQTWSAPQQLNDDSCASGSSHRDPRLSVAPNGRVDVGFYDNRLDSGQHLFDFEYSNSTDDGLTFGANTRVSDTSFDGMLLFTPLANGFQTRDYDTVTGLASTNAGAIAAWGDTRKAPTNSTDVWSSRISFITPPPPPGPTPPGAAPLGTTPPGTIPTGISPPVGLPRASLPGLRLSGRRLVRGRRTIFIVRGALRLPPSIPSSKRSLVCHGLVTVAVRRGHKTGASRTAGLRKDCSFSLTIVISTRKLGRNGRYNIRVRFHGNANLNARSQTTNIR